jgi:hypothetical protein
MLLVYDFAFQELGMRSLATTLILLSVSFAQDSAPAGNRVEWNPSAPDAIKQLPDGRTQRTARTNSAMVSMIADVVSARRFVDPPADGGAEVTYVVIGIRNLSQQGVHIDPNGITLRAVGKKEKQLQRLTEAKVIERAWQVNDRTASALPAMAGSMSGAGMSSPGGRNDAHDAQLQTAVTNKEQDRSNRRLQEASEKQTGAQTAALRDKALLDRDLDPGQQIMGLVFFYPYEKKDKLELTIPVGNTSFVIPFSGKK